ncbi:MAG: Npt1/Npt2 family nucleotide transporter [Bacteroidota bacterium]
MTNNLELSKFRKNIFPIYKHELRKFIPLTFIFFMISFNYSVLRSLKDIYVLEHAGAEVIYYLKLFGVTPAILLLTIAYNRISRVVDRVRKFNIVIAYFLVSFGLSYLFFIPNLESLQLNGLADRLNASIPTMKNLWESIRYWPLSLFYINAEAWGTMALGVLFWTFVNDITGVEQSKRFYSFLSLGAAVGLIIAGVLLKTCKEHLNIVLGACVGIIGTILVVYNSFSYNIRKHPERYQIESRPKKKKEKLSFIESFKFLSKSKYLALIATLIISYGVVISLFESVWKAKIKALTVGNEGMLANIYGNQGILSGVLSIVLIVFLSAPIMHRGWRFAASVTPVVTLVATVIFFSFLYFQDALSSVTALWGMSPLALAVTFGLINVVFIKAFKYTLFDPTKERAYIPLDEESKVRGKAAVDGVGSRLGKSLGSLIITFWIVPMFGSIHNAENIIFVLIIIMLVLWLRAVSKLSVLFKEHEA